MKNLQMKLINKISIDKLLHLLCGAIIYQSSFTALYNNKVNIIISVIIAILITSLIGWLKEAVYDKYITKSAYDSKDLLYTIYGIPFAIIVTIIFDLTIKLIKIIC